MRNHNNLLDGQIHNAKGFTPARKRSVSTKDESQLVNWAKANYTTSCVVTPIADVGGDLHHMYFCISNTDDAVKYAVYLDISGGDAMATPSGYGGVIAADVTASGAGSTALQVGTAIQVVLDAHASFSASVDGAGAVTITGMRSSTAPFDVGTGFSFLITETELIDECLSTDETGIIKWIAKPIASYPFRGYTTSGTTNYAFGEDVSDNQAPFQVMVNYGSATVAGGTITPTNLFRVGQGTVMVRDCVCTHVVGWLTSNGNNDITLAVVKATPVAATTGALVPTVISEITVTGLSNNNKGIILDSGLLNVDLSAGDIVFPMIKEVSGGSDIYFNSTMSTIDRTPTDYGL